MLPKSGRQNFHRTLSERPTVRSLVIIDSPFPFTLLTLIPKYSIIDFQGYVKYIFNISDI